MDTALAIPRTRGAAWSQLWSAWRSLRPVEFSWFVLLGLGYALTDLGSLAELPTDVSPWPTVGRLLLVPMVAAMVLIPFWLVAARHPATGHGRTLRLVGGALLGSMLAMALLWPLVRWLQWPTVGEVLRIAKGRPMFVDWHWGIYASDVLTAFVPATLAFLLFDLVQRQRAGTRRLRRLQTEQSCLAREALASRLAALQAQVEPQFLFDTLVDVEQAYARGAADAPARLEALIHHLRVALPRLRDGSTTLASEAELLASWLAVAHHRLPVPPTLGAAWPPALGGTPLPAMLLLPLMQSALARAAGGGRHPAPGVRLQAGTDGGTITLTLALAAPGLCPPAETLQALAERAQSAWWCPLTLHCDAGADETRFQLRLPCAAARD